MVMAYRSSCPMCQPGLTLRFSTLQRRTAHGPLLTTYSTGPSAWRARFGEGLPLCFRRTRRPCEAIYVTRNDLGTKRRRTGRCPPGRQSQEGDSHITRPHLPSRRPQCHNQGRDSNTSSSRLPHTTREPRTRLRLETCRHRHRRRSQLGSRLLLERTSVSVQRGQLPFD